jgi:hypothetical protein
MPLSYRYTSVNVLKPSRHRQTCHTSELHEPVDTVSRRMDINLTEGLLRNRVSPEEGTLIACFAGSVTFTMRTSTTIVYRVDLAE